MEGSSRDGGGTGGGGPTRSFPGQAQGFWRFDDGNMNRTELGDSTFFGNQAPNHFGRLGGLSLFLQGSRRFSRSMAP
jgi:hypothetical protein